MRKNIQFLSLFLLICCSSGTLIDEKKSSSYFIVAGSIYYSNDGNWFELGAKKCSADKKTFEILNRDIAKDNNDIFYCGERQPHIDYKSFIVTKAVPRDKNFAYKYGFTKLEPIVGADALTFEYLDIDLLNHSWSKDKDHYFKNLKKVNVDYPSFKFISRRFSIDKDSVYADLYEFTSVKFDTSHILVINDEYVRDKNNLYYAMTFMKNEILTLKFESFDKVRIIDNDVICVGNTVVFYGKPFKSIEVDSETFELYHPNQIDFYSKDKNHVYYDQEIIEKANPLTFVPVKFGFGKDDKYVFYEDQILDNADPKTFREEGSIWSDGKNSYDWEGRKL